MILKLIDFLHDAFGIGKDTTATILVTILTFSTGILITIIFKAVEGYLDRRNHRKLLKLNLLNLIKGIFKQANSYEYLCDQINISHMGSFGFSPKSISATGVFYQLGYKNLYSAYFNGFENIRLFNRNKKRIAFNNIWSTLEFLTIFHSKSFEEAQEFFKQNAEANELRNNGLGKVHQIVEGIRLTLHAELVKPSLGLYFNSIENILLTLRNQENRTNPLVANDFFVEPLLELNRNSINVIKEFSNILRPVELNAALLETSLRYINQKSIIEAYYYQFKELSISFYNNYNTMKASYRTLCNNCDF